MKKLRLKKGVIKFLVIIALLMAILISIGNNLNNVSADELGNTCYGSLIKVCGE